MVIKNFINTYYHGKNTLIGQVLSIYAEDNERQRGILSKFVVDRFDINLGRDNSFLGMVIYFTGGFLWLNMNSGEFVSRDHNGDNIKYALKSLICGGIEYKAE